VDRQLIGEEDTFLLAAEGRSESEVIAAQDVALQTKCHATKVLPAATGGRYRLGQQCDNTTGHMHA
jgi:hypothetical protein